MFNYRKIVINSVYKIVCIRVSNFTLNRKPKMTEKSKDLKTLEDYFTHSFQFKFEYKHKMIIDKCQKKIYTQI